MRRTSWPSRMCSSVAEDDAADLADVEVQRDAEDAVAEVQQLVGHRRVQALDTRDAVTRVDDTADLGLVGFVRLVARDEALERVADLLRTDGKLRHQWSLLSLVVTRCGVACLGVRRSTGVNSSSPAGQRQAVGDAAVEEHVADPHREAADRSGSISTLSCTAWPSRRPSAGGETRRAARRSGARRCGPGRPAARAGRPPAARTPRAPRSMVRPRGSQDHLADEDQGRVLDLVAEQRVEQLGLAVGGQRRVGQRAAQRRLAVEDAAEPEQLVLDLVEGVRPARPSRTAPARRARPWRRPGRSAGPTRPVRAPRRPRRRRGQPFAEQVRGELAPGGQGRRRGR